MNTIFINFIFLFFTIWVLLKSIYYGIYEMKQEKNVSGGIVVIAFSLICVVFSNIMFWISLK